MPNLATRQVGNTNLNVSVLGFGAAQLGNLYRTVSDKQAADTLTAALNVGLNYFDTAPYYGLGLSERRVGNALRNRDDVVLSSKVGRILDPAPDVDISVERYGFVSPMPFEPRYDYSYEGILRSHEASLNRLGLAHIDILFVHDIGPLTHGSKDAHYFAQLTEGGGLRALDELRSSGQIQAFGLGVNEYQICERMLDEGDVDCFLLAGRYSLLEQESLHNFLPRCVDRSVSIILGGPYNSGILATGTRTDSIPHYDYEEAPAEIVQRVARIEAVCDEFDVTLAAAALQFPLAHEAVCSVIPGLGKPSRVEQSVELLNQPIPDEFWQTLINQQLLNEAAPVPSGVPT